MSDTAISVEGLGKQYRIGKIQYATLRDRIQEGISAPFRKVASMFGGDSADNGNGEGELFWALKDVSFEVSRGSVLGVIGKNGAGKSTLLKILSRITEPTEGRAEIRGRVGSLLEVGTGFSSELSGRDNIFLNGAILGMKRVEIVRKFDEIVAFAEVEKFIDTAVKHYSSGMYMRLAFAVAAHLEPEILIIDEVLAVGDAAFQKKCIGKIGDVAKHGRTVLFVSHNMQAVQRLCARIVVLEGGQVVAEGEPACTISDYLNDGTDNCYSMPPSPTRPTITRASARVVDSTILLSVEFESPFPLTPPVIGFVMYDSAGNPIFGTNARIERAYAPPKSLRSGSVEIRIATGHFRANRYFLSLWLGDQHSDYCVVDQKLQIDIVNDLGGSLSPLTVGNIYVPSEWTYAPSSNEWSESVVPTAQER